MNKFFKRAITGRGDNSGDQNTSEKDAIASLNRDKKSITGNDSGEKPEKTDTKEESEGDKPAVISGSDSEKKQDSKDSEIVEGGLSALQEDKPSTTNTNINFDFAGLGTIIAKAVADAIKPYQEKLEETEKKIADVEDKAKDTVVKVLNGSGTGKPNPTPQPAQEQDAFAVNFNTRYGTGSGLQGAARDFVQILEDTRQTPVRLFVDSYSQQQYIQRDYRNLTRYWRKNKDAVRADMETYAKKHGLLQGWRASEFRGEDAATLKADVPDAFLVYLSTMVRETHSPTFIYWQFASGALELGKGPGDTIKVARFSFLGSPTNAASRQLTPGTPITSSNQNLTMGSVTVALEELGLPTPVAIPEFISAYSLVNLENVLQNNIGHDWEDYTDLRLRTMLFATTRVVYNSRNTVEEVPANVQTSTELVSGTYTLQFLNNLYAYMRGLKILTYQNGRYALCLHTNALAQLKNDLTPDSFEMTGTVAEIAELFTGANGGEYERVSGYHGNVAGFMIFETNAHSLGIAGTEGAQNETIGGASRLTRASVAFGRNPIAKAVGMPMEVRRDSNDDFGRLARYIWIEHAGYGALDVDPAVGDANQQLRVVEIRSTDAGF